MEAGYQEGRGVPRLVGEAPNASGQVFWEATYFRGRIPRLPGKNLLSEFPGRQSKGCAFPIGPAREAARRYKRGTPKSVPLVLLGRRVSRAFGLSGTAPILEWIEHEGRAVMVFPHPSGINQWWNDPSNRKRADRVSLQLATKGKSDEDSA